MTNEIKKELASSSQVGKIYAMCKNKDIPLPMEYKQLSGLSSKEASDLIDRLEKQETIKSEPKPTNQFSDVGFGMCLKMVEQHIIQNNQNISNEEFNERVKLMYEKHVQAKKFVKANLASHLA